MSDRRALKRSTLAFRHLLEGYWDDGIWVPGDLELVLRGYGIFRDRDWLDPSRLAHLGDEELALRARLEEAMKSLIPALPESTRKSPREALQYATALYIREAVYTWFNRLVALRCLEARVPDVDEAIKVKPDYAGRSLRHDRFCRQYPELCQGEDGGFAAFLRQVCAKAAQELPLLFDPDSPLTLITPSPDALQKCVRSLSGETVSLTRSASDRVEGLTDDVFREPDLLGWIYQYWNTEEKDRVFEAAARGKKIEGADIIPATCIYTEDYMVRFLVENSLGALWVEMHPHSRLPEQWQYFVRDAERRPCEPRPVTDLTFLDPACGSGHFLIYAFDLLWDLYQEEGYITEPAEICRNILERNLYGIDIDERSVQIAAVALYLKAKERAPHFTPKRVNLVVANASVPPDAVQRYLQVHPEDKPLHGVLESIFEGLENVREVGSLLQIEEQLDRAFQELRKQEARRAHDGPQQISMLPLLGLRVSPLQGQMALDMLPPWEAWKPAVLDRLHKQFQQEADATDLSTAIFGTEAEKGLDLIELLSRRYDVVAANPPYMGSKNIGPLLKTYVQRYYPQGKRDLYAAFIQRCLQLVGHKGKVAMVTQQSWMFLRSFTELRKGVLEQQTVDCLAHLGPRAFAEISGEVINIALFVVTRSKPVPHHRLWAARVVGPKNAVEKKVLLRQAVSGTALIVVSRPLQKRFLAIPQLPICYWLRERFFGLLAGRTLDDVSEVRQGLATARDPRFVRFTWEAPLAEWVELWSSRRWMPFEKGGGYSKWFGHHFWVVDWEHDGARIKATPGPRVQNAEYYFKDGWTYSYMASGSVGLRALESRTVFSHLASAVFFHNDLQGGAAALNCRFSSMIVRSISAKIQLNESYVSRIPFPARMSRTLPSLESACITLKRWLVAREPIERTFTVWVPTDTNSLTETYCLISDQRHAVAAILHSLEGISEREMFSAYGITGADLAAVLDETGTPAGWYSLLQGYDALPVLPDGLEVPAEMLTLVAPEPQQPSVDTVKELASYHRRLRDCYEAGPGAKEDAEIEDVTGDSEEESQEMSGRDTCMPLPSESFLEELSQKLAVHPVSMYWLLRTLRQHEGIVCLPELRHYVEDYCTIMILQLVGHRWPKQIEAGEPEPEWIDPNGIIPLTDGTGQRTLLDRVRERIAADFGEARVDFIEQEFRQIMGRSLADWLTRDFFPHHVSQFKRRPIIWLLESGRTVDMSRETATGRRGRRSARTRGSAFSCLVYYHKLTADTLTRIKTHYLRAVLQRQEFELAEERRRAAEGIVAARSAAERLAEVVDELKTFEVALDTVGAKGFLSRRLEQLLTREEPDHWARRTPKSPIPDKEVFSLQEQLYDPDLNDGVRVNIAPLQKSGLLAADVLANKDAQRAIEDRAEWRAEERRWCREGKLPKPGWWQQND